VLEYWSIGVLVKREKDRFRVQRHRAQGKRSFEFLVLSVELKG
jgi:hypothetical protein